MSSKSFLAKAALAAVLAVTVVGCAVQPKIRSQTAPGASVASYRTYGFFEKLGTDDSTYASVLSLNLKSAVSREMDARGYRLATTNPDLLINFYVREKDKIEGSGGPTWSFGLGGFGGPWRSGYGWGVGINDADLRTRTEGTLSIDVVDRARNEIVWAGSALSTVTAKQLDDPRAAIDATVPKIFAKFPGRAAP